MRLRNLFMILLLCMTVGMFGVSCTGDDGAQGPPGPKGDTGEPGEVTEADIPEDTDFYPFLESWGVKDGEVGCNDDVLKGMGPLPGPDLVDLMPSDRTLPDGNDPNPFNAPLAVQCDAPGVLVKFTDTVEIDVGGPQATPVAGANRHMVFWKTGRAMEKSDPVRTPADDFGEAKETSTTKHFVGGLVFAELNEDGKGESLDRELLYNECGVGSIAPPSIRGHWKAVQVIDSVTEYEERDKQDPVSTTTLTKFCVVLDAHPGVTKCYVSERQTDASYKTTIALYDGTELDTVVDHDDIGDNAAETAFTAVELFVDSAPTDAPDFGVTTGETVNGTLGAHLCNLFGSDN